MSELLRGGVNRLNRQPGHNVVLNIVPPLYDGTARLWYTENGGEKKTAVISYGFFYVIVCLILFFVQDIGVVIGFRILSRHI